MDVFLNRTVEFGFIHNDDFCLAMLIVNLLLMVIYRFHVNSIFKKNYSNLILNESIYQSQKNFHSESSCESHYINNGFLLVIY